MRGPRLPALLLLLPLGLACGARVEAPRHLVLITVDTLRADRIGAYGYAEARTPHLDGLAAESLRFERAYAHASITLPSIASLLTGLLPTEHHLFANLHKLHPRFATLATRLDEAGFGNGAFVGAYALRPQRGLARGFSHYTETYQDRESVRPWPENLGEALTRDALAWVDQRTPGERLFLWVHYQEPHGPYTPPEFEPPADGGPELPRSDTQSGRGAIPSYQWLGHGRLGEYEARYDGEIREMDRHLGALLDGLRSRGILDRSVLVFTADHGESFGEDGLYCAHGESLDESLLRVPLLLRAPGIDPGVRRDAVRLIDVAPTALALLGVPASDLRGRSLLDDVGDRALVAQIVAFGGRRYRTIREDGFELSETPEGSEVSSLDGSEPAPPALRRRLVAGLDTLAPWPLDDQPPPRLTPVDREALRKLGYVE